MKEAEAAKAKALARDSDLEGEDDDIQDLEETDDKVSTFQEDMETVCDFMVTTATPFSTKLLQGECIRAMFSFDEHKKPTKAEEKEDLGLLSEI